MVKILNPLYRKTLVTSSGGEVLIAVKNEYNNEDVPELDTNCEIVWAKLHLVQLLATVQFTCAHITDTMYLMKRASTSLRDQY